MGQIPSAPWFTTVPFGPPAGEFLAWLKYGGGHKLKDEIYARHGVKGISCIMIAPEASGWFRREIKTVADLRGLKMRFFGLGGCVMQKLGVSTLARPGDATTPLTSATRPSPIAPSTLRRNTPRTVKPGDR